MSADVYGASRTKRTRATKGEMKQRRDAIARIIERIRPCGVRQTFYQAEIGHVVDKSEAGYEKTQRMTVWLRQLGIIPYGWITDGTRWQRKPQSFSSIEAALQETVRSYRRAVWRDEPVYVEFWIEKDALAGTIYDVTAEFDVPLMVARGYSSLSFLHSAAEAIKVNGKAAYIYHLGDWDPSGQDAADHIERKLREFAPGVPIHFTKLAVTGRQIVEWKLPTRPTKKSDSRSKNWKGDSVELDAVDPNNLRQLVRSTIERHISPQRIAIIEVIEASEREGAEMFLRQRLNGGAP
jgi:hypothetical protein